MTLTNNGGATLTISSMTVTGDFHVASTSCGATLSPNTACTMLIVFAPTVGGARTGSLTLVDDAPSGRQTAALSGTGIDFTLIASSTTSVTVTSGTSATYSLVLTAPAGVSGSAAMTCTGAPSHGLCTVNPSPVALNGSVNVIVTVQTGLAQAQLDRPLLGIRNGLVVLALLVPLGFFTRPKKRLQALLIIFVIASTLSLGGCGAGRQLPADGINGPVTPTSSGTYALNVSATSAGVTKSVGLTLIVK